jgi:hypothetical protein
MELFDSYTYSNAIICDATSICFLPDPISRVYCHDVTNICGICGGLIVTNGLVLCSCDDSWNCNLCSNDKPFWMPYQEGDTIDFQFQQPDEITGFECMNGWLPANLLSPTNTAFATFAIKTCCDDTELLLNEDMFEAIVILDYVGTYNTTDYSQNESTSPIQMIRFNLDAIRQYLEADSLETCFYFEFTFTTTRQCLGVTESTITFCSEPFKEVACSNYKRTQVLESVYPKEDCFGMYYGTNFNSGTGTPFQYSNKIRVPGFFEQTNFSITKEIISTSLRTTMSQYSEVWQLRTNNLPQSFVKYLVNIFTGRSVYVNGKEYQVQGDINRNNDTGSHWYLEVNFESIGCNKSLTCE